MVRGQKNLYFIVISKKKTTILLATQENLKNFASCVYRLKHESSKVRKLINGSPETPFKLEWNARSHGGRNSSFLIVSYWIGGPCSIWERGELCDIQRLRSGACKITFFTCGNSDRVCSNVEILFSFLHSHIELQKPRFVPTGGRSMMSWLCQPLAHCHRFHVFHQFPNLWDLTKVKWPLCAQQSVGLMTLSLAGKEIERRAVNFREDKWIVFQVG